MKARHKTICFIWLTVFVFIYSLPKISADTIYMKNGEVIEGKIISNDDGTIVIKEKFGDFGYGEAEYQMSDVHKIITPDNDLLIATDEEIILSLKELQTIVDSKLGKDNLITGFAFKNGVYRIRYYYPTFGNKVKDRAGVEENVFKVLSIFADNKIDGFKSIEIEASTVGKYEKGILCNAEINRKQFEKYKNDPGIFLIGEIEKFIFFDQFYSF